MLPARRTGKTMNSNSPSIIFNCGYSSPTDTSQKNSFYRCKKSDFNVIEYLDRNGAADKSTNEDIEKIKSFIEDTNMPENSILGYAKNRQGSTGIFSKHSDSPDIISEKLSKTNSIIWHSVLSFSPNISSEFCANKQDAEKIIREHFPDFFKSKYGEKVPLKYENIDWFAAYHTNTDNRHIHLVFWEKEPKIIDRNGNASFRQTGRINSNHFSEFKSSVAKGFLNHSLDYLSMRDDIRKNVSLHLSDKAVFDDLLRHSQSILANGHFQYKRLDGLQKKTIDRFVNTILCRDPHTKQKYDDYKKKLADTQAEYIKIYSDNHMGKIPYEVSRFYSSRVQELNNRLGNELLKHLKDYAFKKNELEKSVGYKNGAWEPSKLSPKNRKAIVTRELSKFATSALNLFFSEATPTIEGQRLSDEEYRKQLKMEGKETIYE